MAGPREPWAGVSVSAGRGECGPTRAWHGAGLPLGPGSHAGTSALLPTSCSNKTVICVNLPSISSIALALSATVRFLGLGLSGLTIGGGGDCARDLREARPLPHVAIIYMKGCQVTIKYNKSGWAAGSLFYMTGTGARRSEGLETHQVAALSGRTLGRGDICREICSVNYRQSVITPNENSCSGYLQVNITGSDMMSIVETVAQGTCR